MPSHLLIIYYIPTSMQLTHVAFLIVPHFLLWGRHCYPYTKKLRLQRGHTEWLEDLKSQTPGLIPNSAQFLWYHTEMSCLLSWMIPHPKTRNPGFTPEILSYWIHGFFLQHFLMNSTHIAQMLGCTLGCQNEVKCSVENFLIGDYHVWVFTEV